MDAKQLRYFKIVYEKRSINQAAKELFITPQGLSKVIANLENELETKLFSRDSKGAAPYRAADVLYENVNTLIAQFDKVQQAIRLNSLEKHTLRITCARGVLNALSIDVIYDFLKEYPQIEVNWQVMTNERIKESITTFISDVGLMVGQSGNPDLEEHCISKREVIVLVYEGHPFYDKESISIKELQGEKILILDEQYQLYHDFITACHRAGYVPDIVVKAEDSHFLYQLSSRKMGLGILIDFSVRDFTMSKVKAIPLEGALTWDIYYVIHKSNCHTESVQNFIEYIHGL